MCNFGSGSSLLVFTLVVNGISRVVPDGLKTDATICKNIFYIPISKPSRNCQIHAEWKTKMQFTPRILHYLPLACVSVILLVDTGCYAKKDVIIHRSVGWKTWRPKEELGYNV